MIGDFLICKKHREDTKMVSSLNLTYTYLELPKDDQDTTNSHMDQYALKLARGTEFSVLVAKNKEEYAKWVEVLSSCTIRTDVHSKYVFENVLAAGSSSRIFKAKEIASGETLAVKGFSKDLLQQMENGFQSVWEEIKIMRLAAGSPNLIQLKEVHETTHSIYLIMNLAEDGDLQSLLDKNPNLKEEELLNIARGLLQGLHELAKKNIHHRNIKPSNILLRSTKNIQPEDVFIADFGLAKNLNGQSSNPNSWELEELNCPEIRTENSREQNNSLAMDMYSTGAVLYYLCSGFPLPSNYRVIHRRSHPQFSTNAVDFSFDRIRALSNDLKDLLKSMLELDPSRRFSAQKALNHPAFSAYKGELSENDQAKLNQPNESRTSCSNLDFKASVRVQPSHAINSQRVNLTFKNLLPISLSSSSLIKNKKPLIVFKNSCQVRDSQGLLPVTSQSNGITFSLIRKNLIDSTRPDLQYSQKNDLFLRVPSSRNFLCSPRGCKKLSESGNFLISRPAKRTLEH